MRGKGEFGIGIGIEGGRKASGGVMMINFLPEIVNKE